MVKGVFLQFLLPPHSTFFTPLHCVEIVQIQSFFWSVFSSIRTEYGPEKTPYLDRFHTVLFLVFNFGILSLSLEFSKMYILITVTVAIKIGPRL